jgi:hypothetical protein
MQITIVIQGVDQLAAKLGRVLSPETLRAPLAFAQKLLHDRMAEYPPPRPTSTYVRTGDLGTGWAMQGIEDSGFAMSASVSNEVSYAPFVQGDESQSAIHEGYWKTDAMIVTESAAEIGADFTAAIEGALNS